MLDARLFIAILIVSATAPALAGASAAPARDFIVTFAALPEDVRQGHYGDDAVVGTNEALGFAVVRTANEHVLAARAQRDANVITLEPDVARNAFLTPNDPYFAPYQYDLKAPTTGIDAAWDITLGSSSVKVAIADTGIRTTAQDLVGICIAGQRDFVSNDGTAEDGNGHGSHVASTIFAKIDNGKGLAGISQSCGLFARVLNNQGSGTCSGVANGISWAADQGAHVISLSLGGGACSAEQTAVNYAIGKGALIVAAAGNGGCTNCVEHPAKYAGVVAVSCTTASNALCSYSSTGPEVFIAAPGDQTVGHYPAKSAGCGKRLDTCYALLSGTSMSTPHVSGVAALIKSTHATYSASDIKNALQSSARDLGAAGRDNDFGWGLLQATSV